VLPNGNKWVGTGHNTVFRDAAGRWWTIYHAVNRSDPYFAFAPGFTKRPALLDPLDWVNGWPTVRAGRWASAQRMPAPATSPTRPSAYRPDPPAPVRLGAEMPAFSDDFSDGLDAWTWVGTEPDPSTYDVRDGALRWETQTGDIARKPNTAGVLSRKAPPSGDFAVQTRVRLNLPPEGCCFNYAQAGIVLHNGLDRFVKLAHVSIWNTRQTEFAKEVPESQALDVDHMYGNGVVGPPGDLTTLRIVVDRRNGPDLFTAYTKQGGSSWVQGGTWTHNLGDNMRIGLISLGVPDGAQTFTARFLDVQTYRLAR
jgi:arabinan endo-1,5-alpha-L-arabinosidase